MKHWVVLILCIPWCPSLQGQPAGTNSAASDRTERRVLEEKHFIECLAYVYSPALWISYHGALYFAPKTDTEARQIDALKAARAKYVALTNREARHELAAQAIVESGIPRPWQDKILLPYSETQQNLTPTLNRALRAPAQYKLSQSLPDGDALIEDSDGPYLVMDFARIAALSASTNLYLIKEGEKSFTTAPGEYKRIEAYTSVALSKEEIAVLNRVVAACQARTAILARELARFKAREEFEDSKARATDSNPYLQYLVARSYLDGKGTPKDEKLGMEWMNKAARNGSGDARTYLQAHGASSN